MNQSRMNRIQNLSFILILLLALSVILSGCSPQAEQSSTPVPTPIVLQKPTYTVQRGTVTKTIELTGRVSPVKQQDLFFRSDGFVHAVYFTRGDSVKTGDVLAELDMGSLEVDLAEAELALQIAETKLAKAQQENLDSLVEAELALIKANLESLRYGGLGVVDSVAAAEANVTQAEAELRKAEAANIEAQDDPDKTDKEKEDHKKAYEEAKRRLVNARSLLAAEIAMVSAQEAMDAALQAYEQSVGDPSLTTEQKEALVQSLDQARQAYLDAWEQYAEALGGEMALGLDARMHGIDAALAKLKIDILERGVDPLLLYDVQQAGMKLDTVTLKMNNARLIAPFDGEIISLGLAPGNQVTAFDAVLTLADPSELEITAIPAEDDLTGLGVDQPVLVRLASSPGLDLTGQVRLLPFTSTTGSDTGDNDRAVHISLDDPAADLQLGEIATAIIHIDEHAGVLWLPPSALRTFQGRDFVFIDESGVQRRVDVRLGLESDDRIEILDGLAEGQVVVGP